MSDKPDIQTEGGAYVEGDVTVTGDFVGRDKITTIIAGLARWQTYLLLTIGVLVIGLIALVGLPYIEQLSQHTAPPPDPAGLQAISASQGLAITALAISRPWLWLGVRKGEDFFLYKADSTEQTHLTLLPVTAVAAKINQMTVDCHGNLWLLLEDLGTQRYDTATGQLSDLLNRTTAARLSKSTMYAIATRCLPDKQREIWLGREGVYTLRDQGTMTVSLAAQLLPVADDHVYAATRTIPEVRALLAVTHTLWVADRAGEQLLALSPDGMTKAQSFLLHDTPWSLTSDRQNGDLWVGADEHLFQISKGTVKQQVALAADTTAAPILRAYKVAVEGDYLWIGDGCVDDSGMPCCPLATYVIGANAPFCFAAQLQSVNDLIFDEQHTLWIATNNGLFLFSTTHQS